MDFLLLMKTINLYSSSYYNSGTSTQSIGLEHDRRWKHHIDDNSELSRRESNAKNAYIHGIEHDTFRYILNSVGLDCDYTKKKNESHTFRIVDVGSYEDWRLAAQKANTYFDNKPFILHSSQEPCPDAVPILNEFPKCFIMDLAYGEPAHDRHMPFPSFFTRLINNFLNVNINYHTINLSHGAKKEFIFNNLKFRADGVKTLTQFFLTVCDNVLDKGIVTYTRDKGYLSSYTTDDRKLNLFRDHWVAAVEKNRHVIEPYYGPAKFNKDKLLSLDEFNNFYYHSNDITLNNFGLSYKGDRNFNYRRRYHPIWVYNDSYFSMITESTGCNDNIVFSEKSIYPIMHGHPFIINQNNQGALYKGLTELGFELFDEILTYPEDNTCHSDALINCAENIQTFDTAKYQNNIQSIVKKSAHNRSNMLNTRSVLWTKLRELMLEYLDRYFDACSEGSK